MSSDLEAKQTGIIQFERTCRSRLERKKKEKRKKGVNSQHRQRKKKRKKKETKEKNDRQHELRNFWLSLTWREKKKKEKREPVSVPYREVKYV